MKMGAYRDGTRTFNWGAGSVQMKNGGGPVFAEEKWGGTGKKKKL